MTTPRTPRNHPLRPVRRPHAEPNLADRLQGTCKRIDVGVARRWSDSGVSGFDWDDGNRTHCRKHGVSLAEIEELLSGQPFVAPALKHAHLEDRLIAVGRNRAGRPLFVAFTIRETAGQRLIRPVSARYMHAKEIERYDAEGS
jgi:uncharacterized DUF497 family protein